MTPTSKSMGIIAAIIVAVVVVGVFSLILYDQSSKEISIKIATDKLIGGLPLFVTLDQNLLDEHGISYTKDVFPTASQVAESLVADQHDLGGPISLVDIFIVESKHPGQFKLFSVYAEPSTSPISHVIVKSDSPYSSMEDLRGKKMAIGPGVTPEFLAKTLVKKFYDVKEVSFVVLPPGSWIQALEAGQVDAVYSIEPFTTIAVQNGVGRVILEGAESYVIDPMPIVGIAFTSKFVDENAKIASDIVDASDKAVKIINEDPEKARRALTNFTDLSQDISDKINLASSYGSKDLNDLKETIQKFADLVYEEGYMDKKIDVTNILYQR